MEMYEQADGEAWNKLELRFVSCILYTCATMSVIYLFFLPSTQHLHRNGFRVALWASHLFFCLFLSLCLFFGLPDLKHTLLTKIMKQK